MMLEGILYEVVSREEGSATVRLLPDSPVYAAHFPGYPITPGVTIVQMALELMGRKLSAAKDIKFVEPVLPSPSGTILRFTWTFPEPERADVNVYLEEETLCSKMVLSVAPAGREMETTES